MRCWQIVLLVVGIAVPSIAANADNDHDRMDAPINSVQERCVKIYGAGMGREHGYATGLIVSPDGLILTAQGMYLNGSQIHVVLPDGQRCEAKVIRRSEKIQTALLKIDVRTPYYFTLREEAAEPGEWVMAVSNAFNVATGDEKLSVSLGVISARSELRARHRAQDVPYEGDVLLIDAITSNPGASGGALAAADGRLVGMLGKLLESQNTGTRINYAVPVGRLKQFVDGADAAVASPERSGEAKTESQPAYLGIRLFRVGGDGVPACVDGVSGGSPAKTAGIRKDDLILAVGGVEIHTCRQYDEALRRLQPGTPTTILVKRGTSIKTIELTPSVKTEVPK